MLKCIPRSEATKLGGVAATYRAQTDNIYGTCPSTCPLKPKCHKGAKKLDEPYLETVLRSVPRHGIAWTYTHFPLATIQPYLSKLPQTQTTINLSTDTVEQACEYQAAGYPTVLAIQRAPHKHWRQNQTRFVVCPATYNKEVTCFNCGGGVPLCAKPNRPYVIVFPAHGHRKYLVGSQDKGGCYGELGNVRLHWDNASKGIGRTILQDNEEVTLLPIWTKLLPKHTLLRHHIVGDLGCLKKAT